MQLFGRQAGTQSVSTFFSTSHGISCAQHIGNVFCAACERGNSVAAGWLLLVMHAVELDAENQRRHAATSTI